MEKFKRTIVAATNPVSDLLVRLLTVMDRNGQTPKSLFETLAAGLENNVFVCRTAYSTEDGAYDIVLTCKCSSSFPLWLLPKPRMMMGGKMVGQVRLVDGWALHRPLQDHQPQRPRDGLPARHGACALLPDA